MGETLPNRGQRAVSIRRLRAGRALEQLLPGDASMKPYVICHMVSSVDGRILSSRWRPKGEIQTQIFWLITTARRCDTVAFCAPSRRRRNHRANRNGIGGSAAHGLGRRDTAAPGGLLSA